jgi:hypothetical protein
LLSKQTKTENTFTTMINRAARDAGNESNGDEFLSTFEWISKSRQAHEDLFFSTASFLGLQALGA